jgi:hypothetical protein
MGAAIGVSADGAYAGFTDQTPVIIANALVKLAHGIGQGVGLIATDAGSHIDSSILPVGVWSFIGASVIFMGASFFIEHDKAHPVVPGSSTYRGGGRNLKRGRVSSFRVR